MGRAAIFGDLPKRKEAGLKAKSAGQTIRCMALRCNRYMVMKRGNQVVRIALRFDCRRIGQPVEKRPNNQQAQQTRRDLGFHSLVGLGIDPL